MKYLNQHFLPSDCDLHFRLLKIRDEIPCNLSIKSIRAFLSQHGQPSDKYADEWRNKAICLGMGAAFGKTTPTIADVTKEIRLV